MVLTFVLWLLPDDLNEKTVSPFLVTLSIHSYAQPKRDSIAIEHLLQQAKDQMVELKYDQTYETLLEALNLAQKSNQQAMVFKTEIAIANMYLMKDEVKQAKNFFEHKFPDKSFP